MPYPQRQQPAPRPQQQQRQQQKKPAAGAPGAGAGGQKAGGQAVPPKKQAQPKPQPQPGGARPLTPQQTRQLAKAQAGGREAQYLANHPGVAKHQQRIGAAAAPAPGNPAAGAGGGKPNAPAAQPQPAPTPDAAAPAAPAAPAADNTFESGFNAQFGKGAMDQFGNMGWYGANPIETAWKAGQQGLQKDLSGINERFAQGGMGTSSRNLLSQQSAASDFETQFADKAAQLGLGARENDLNRLATMFAGAGEQQLAGKAQELAANQQLANIGTGITAIGAQEQQIPNLPEMGSILANFGNVQSLNRGAINPPAK